MKYFLLELGGSFLEGELKNIGILDLILLFKIVFFLFDRFLLLRK